MSEWTIEKKMAFTKAFGKRQGFSKGGRVRKLPNRKRLASGGPVNPYADVTDPSGNHQAPGPTASYIQANPVPNSGEQGPYVSNSAVNNPATNPNTGIMGSINNAIGLNDQFQAGAANIASGTTAQQLTDAYNNSNSALAQQGNLVNTLNPQASNAVQNQNQLANQYSAMSRGEGPNPAQAQLAQATGKNVANQAALMAGQRGASNNAGMIARQAAEQGATTQQDSVGQAATLQAQQQIAAQQNLANLSNNQISQSGQATTGLNSAAQNEQALLQNANTSYNNAAVGMQSNINNVDSQTAAANQNMAANTFGGVMSAASSASKMFGAKGGVVDTTGKDHHIMLAEMNAQSLAHAKNYDDGGEVDKPDLGSFKAGDADASSPNVPSTAALPTDTADFSKAIQAGGSSGGGGGGGGGGMSSMMSLAALMADGGQIQPNPLLQGNQMNNTASWGPGVYNAGSASGGPNIGSTSSLPGNHIDFAKKIKELSEKKDDKKPQPPEGASTQPPAQSMAGGAGDDNDLPDNPRPPEAGMETAYDTPQTEMAAKGGVMGPHKSHVANYLFSKGGPVPVMVSPGEVYLSPDKVNQVVNEGANPMKIGKHIPGKASKKNDSLKNDTVPMDAEEGAVVIPRHITTHKMAPEKAELFVHRALKRKKGGA